MSGKEKPFQDHQAELESPCHSDCSRWKGSHDDETLATTFTVPAQRLGKPHSILIRGSRKWQK
jgi:hypothetical protein